uniref:Uncharacterized protein n=1 Tax=Physcomitrium patens TaxID=3218 RepID=A0A2K1J4G2_PHYPA|nr:hypothetical protein PHYPA_022270 [Physcomitrium patens]
MLRHVSGNGCGRQVQGRSHSETRSISGILLEAEGEKGIVGGGEGGASPAAATDRAGPGGRVAEHGRCGVLLRHSVLDRGQEFQVETLWVPGEGNDAADELGGGQIAEPFD